MEGENIFQEKDEIKEESNDLESLLSSLTKELGSVDSFNEKEPYNSTMNENRFIAKLNAIAFADLLKEVGHVESEEAKLVVRKILNKLESAIEPLFVDRPGDDDDLDKKAKRVNAKKNSLEIIQRLKDI